MARFNRMLAAIAGAGLVLAQPGAALAQGTDDGSSEAPGSGPVIGLLAAVGLVFLIMAVSDGDDPTQDLPTSP